MEGTAVDKTNALQIDVPLNKITDSNYLVGVYDQETDKITGAHVQIGSSLPPSTSGRRYEFINETPMLDLVKHHFEGWNNTGVTFWLNRETGGIVDCTALANEQSATAGT